MTDREATMKAYNALHFNLPVIEDYGTKEQLEVQHNAINALDHALAQPEQEPIPYRTDGFLWHEAKLKEKNGG